MHLVQSRYASHTAAGHFTLGLNAGELAACIRTSLAKNNSTDPLKSRLFLMAFGVLPALWTRVGLLVGFPVGWPVG